MPLCREGHSKKERERERVRERERESEREIDREGPCVNALPCNAKPFLKHIRPALAFAWPQGCAESQKARGIL